MHRSPGPASACARLPIMVRTLRGLEAISRAEVAAVLGPAVVTTEHRTLRFSVRRLDERLLDLGTVDDAFLVLADVDGIDHRRSALDALIQLARTIDAPGTVAALAALRPIGPPTLGETSAASGQTAAATSVSTRAKPRASSRAIGFDLTASFIGRRNYSRFEVEDRVGHAIAAATGWAYGPRSPQMPVPRASLSIRVHILHERATLAVRLGERPLHRRAYRLESRPGALRGRRRHAPPDRRPKRGPPRRQSPVGSVGRRRRTTARTRRRPVGRDVPRARRGRPPGRAAPGGSPGARGRGRRARPRARSRGGDLVQSVAEHRGAVADPLPERRRAAHLGALDQFVLAQLARVEAH